MKDKSSSLNLERKSMRILLKQNLWFEMVKRDTFIVTQTFTFQSINSNDEWTSMPNFLWCNSNFECNLNIGQ